VSYGTRVAQHYLQRFPDAVRTLIIDGVVPIGLALGPDIALNAQATLNAILARCSELAYCAEAFPDLEGHLRELSARLQREPVPLEVPHPVTGRRASISLHYAQLAMSLRLMSYAPETAALIPLIIDEAAVQRNYLPLAAQAVLIEDSLLTSISFGMHNSVVCTEDVPFYRNLDALWPKLEDTYIGASQVRALQGICELWPTGLLHPSLREPVRSDRPVLLLSGELDPITPPTYAERAATTYPNSLNLVAPGQGHGVVGRGCVPMLVSDFVSSGNLDEVDPACLERLGNDAFFVDLLGPPP
jgi:pimeloyl-ACP methyl ester carboxylesterase